MKILERIVGAVWIVRKVPGIHRFAACHSRIDAKGQTRNGLRGEPGGRVDHHISPLITINNAVRRSSTSFWPSAARAYCKNLTSAMNRNMDEGSAPQCQPCGRSQAGKGSEIVDEMGLI